MNFFDNIIRDKKADGGKSDIQIFDFKDVYIEGCNGVVEYNENIVILSLNQKNVQISGFKLQLFNYSKDGVEVSGEIRSISFEEKEALK